MTTALLLSFMASGLLRGPMAIGKDLSDRANKQESPQLRQLERRKSGCREATVKDYRLRWYHSLRQALQYPQVVLKKSAMVEKIFHLRNEPRRLWRMSKLTVITRRTTADLLGLADLSFL